MHRNALIALVVVAACTDKATADFNTCVDLDAKGIFDKARAACVAAVNADGTSKDGVAAAVRQKFRAENPQPRRLRKKPKTESKSPKCAARARSGRPSA